MNNRCTNPIVCLIFRRVRVMFRFVSSVVVYLESIDKPMHWLFYNNVDSMLIKRTHFFFVRLNLKAISSDTHQLHATAQRYSTM